VENYIVVSAFCLKNGMNKMRICSLDTIHPEVSFLAISYAPNNFRRTVIYVVDFRSSSLFNCLFAFIAIRYTRASRS